MVEIEQVGEKEREKNLPAPWVHTNQAPITKSLFAFRWLSVRVAQGLLRPFKTISQHTTAEKTGIERETTPWNENPLRKLTIRV